MFNTVYFRLQEIFLQQKQQNTNIKATEGFPGGSDGKESTCNEGDLGSIPGQGNPLEKGMANKSSVLAWKIPWTEETGKLQCMVLQSIGHD